LPNHPGIEAQTSVRLLTGEMKAWWAEGNLFHQGGAKESEDAAVAAASSSSCFRFALCAFMHALHWRVKGGVEDRLPERMRNDIDVSYAAYALCFDGIITEDSSLLKSTIMAVPCSTFSRNTCRKHRAGVPRELGRR
jgi:hypothetical protein